MQEIDNDYAITIRLVMSRRASKFTYLAKSQLTGLEVTLPTKERSGCSGKNWVKFLQPTPQSLSLQLVGRDYQNVA